MPTLARVTRRGVTDGTAGVRLLSGSPTCLPPALWSSTVEEEANNTDFIYLSIRAGDQED